MATFRLAATVTVSAYTTVEAKTYQEALKIAERREAVIGGHGSGLEEDENWIVDEADGVPENICPA